MMDWQHAPFHQETNGRPTYFQSQRQGSKHAINSENAKTRDLP